MKTWIEVSPYTGIEEEMPANNASSGAVDMNPTGRKLKKEPMTRMDGRTKGYREHRAKLEASRAKRQERLAKKNSSNFIEKVKESVIQQEYMSGVGRDAKPMAALNAAKSSTGYDLYHDSLSSAMRHAFDVAKKRHGITIDPKEIRDKVAMGPSKPSSGKTNKYSLKGDKGTVQIQVYNKGGGSKPFELNMYKS